MIRLPCSKCGSSDHDKYRRMKKRKSGKITSSMASYCILCHREDQKVIEERRYDKKLAYNRQWRNKNKEKKNKYAKDYYWKNKKRYDWTLTSQMVEWHGAVDPDGFSKMTYTPLMVHGGR